MTGATPLATVDPDKLVLGLGYARGAHWGAVTRMTAVHRQDRPASATAATPGGYTVVDVTGWYSLNKATTLHVGLRNLFDKKYVEWADVRGLSATSTVIDAYSQPGRNFTVSLTRSF